MDCFDYEKQIQVYYQQFSTYHCFYDELLLSIVFAIKGDKLVLKRGHKLSCYIANQHNKKKNQNTKLVKISGNSLDRIDKTLR